MTNREFKFETQKYADELSRQAELDEFARQKYADERRDSEIARTISWNQTLYSRMTEARDVASANYWKQRSEARSDHSQLLQANSQGFSQFVERERLRMDWLKLWPELSKAYAEASISWANAAKAWDEVAAIRKSYKVIMARLDRHQQAERDIERRIRIMQRRVAKARKILSGRKPFRWHDCRTACRMLLNETLHQLGEHIDVLYEEPSGSSQSYLSYFDSVISSDGSKVPKIGTPDHLVLRKVCLQMNLVANSHVTAQKIELKSNEASMIALAKELRV